MAWTVAQDVIDRWVGPGAPSVTSQIDLLIEDAEQLIVEKFPKIQDRIDDGSLKPVTIKRVVSGMVARVYQNPENLSYFQRTTGPFGSGKTFRDSGVSGLGLSDSDIAALSPRIGGAFSVDLLPNPDVRRW